MPREKWDEMSFDNLSRPRKRVWLFGHFAAGNFGNDATFEAMLWNIRRLIPSVDLACISTFADNVAANYGVKAVPATEVISKPWRTRNRFVKLFRRLAIGVPSEAYRWIKAYWNLRRAQMFIVVGTGLMTDSFTLTGWGPYNLFKWCAVAKLCGCKLVFVSVGAGPLDTFLGRKLAIAALRLGDFRSYRDEATVDYLERIGFRAAADDPVFPDLAYSLTPVSEPESETRTSPRPVVGIGVMDFGCMYGVEKTTEAQYMAYRGTLVGFVEWLIARGYDIRLIVGDRADHPVVEQFKALLQERSVPAERIIAEPITSTENLLAQIAATELVVATRFHNVLLSLFLHKPVIAVSFHHKCSSLMGQFGLTEFCQDIQRLNGEKLIEQFCRLEKDSDELKEIIAARCEDFRRQLEEQYKIIFKEWLPSSEPTQAIDDGQQAAVPSPVQALAHVSAARKNP